MMENAYIHCLNPTSVWRRQGRRRPVCTHGRAAVVTEETSSNGFDGGGGDR
jgi:hypothetical protein